VTPYELANKFGIRLSVARQILKENEERGQVVPYIRESKFVVYTTPSELKKRESKSPIMIADVLEEVASSVPEESVITEEIDTALLAAASMTSVKPSRLARKRRETGERKEKAKDRRPEVVIEPLEKAPERDDDERLDALDVKPELKPRPKPKPKPEKTTPAKIEEPPKPGKKSTKKTVEKKKDTPPTDTKKSTEKIPEKKPEVKKETKPKATKTTKPLVSDLPGVGSATEEKLAEAGFKTVLKISKADSAKIAEKVSGISEDKAKEIIKAAQELLK